MPLFCRLFTKQTECLAPLLYIIANSPEIQLRQIAGVLLKRNIYTLFSNLTDENQKEEIKKVLLDRYFQEPSKPVRESIGRVISVISETQNTVGKGWDELIAAIDQKTDLQAPIKEREKGIALISFLVELTANEINTKYEKYLQFFMTNLKDAERSVSV